MKRKTLRRIHITAAVGSILCIASFWTSSIIAELFFSHGGIAILKKTILYALCLFIPLMMATGITGMKLGGKSKNPLVLKKKKRMPIIALNGIFILLPCAIILNNWAQAGRFDSWFLAVQILELVVGAVNLTLMITSFREGVRLTQ